MPKQDFNTWMAKVNAWLFATAQVTDLDIPDWGYYDAYEAGTSPAKAAAKALKAAGGF